MCCVFFVFFFFFGFFFVCLEEGVREGGVGGLGSGGGGGKGFLKILGSAQEKKFHLGHKEVNISVLKA